MCECACACAHTHWPAFSPSLHAQIPSVPTRPAPLPLLGRPCPAGEVRCMAASGACLLSGSADGAVKLWDLQDGSLLDTWAEPQPSSISALAHIGPLMVRAFV